MKCFNYFVCISTKKNQQVYINIVINRSTEESLLNLSSIYRLFFFSIYSQRVGRRCWTTIWFAFQRKWRYSTVKCVTIFSFHSKSSPKIKENVVIVCRKTGKIFRKHINFCLKFCIFALNTVGKLTFNLSFQGSYVLVFLYYFSNLKKWELLQKISYSSKII